MRDTLVLNIGDRVRVVKSGHLFENLTGHIEDPPSGFDAEQQEHGFAMARDFAGELFYWVAFDKPTFNELFDGPCEGAAISCRHLQKF